MTEIIIATLTGPGGKRVPVCKRRIVRMWAGTGSEPAALTASQVRPEPNAAGTAAIRYAGQVADYLKWQVSSLENLPQGMSELALMGFRSVVGTDMAGAYRQVRSLQASLRAAALGQDLPQHRRLLEGLLAFGQLAVDGANQGLVPDDANRKATQAHLSGVTADLTELLRLLDRLERPVQNDLSAPAATDHDSEG